MALKQDSKSIQAHIKEVLSGKSSSYEQLYITHIGRIYTFGLNFFAHNKQVAEELAKRVFIKGFEQIKNYPDSITFIVWLKKIMVEEIRKGGMGKSILVHQSSNVDQAIFSLTEEERIIFILNDVDKLSVDEINEITGASLDDLKLKLADAHRIMMEKLDVKNLEDLDYKVNFVTKKSDPKPELWNVIYNEIHSIATKDLTEDTKEEILNIGDAKISIGEKIQKFKDEQNIGEECRFKLNLKIPKKVYYIFFLLLFVAAVIWLLIYLKVPKWEVTNLGGSPTIKKDSEKTIVTKSSVFEEGEILSTDQDSKAVIKIPKVGKVYLNPGSTVQRSGKLGEISIMAGDINIVKSSSKLFPIELSSAVIEDYKFGSYSIKTNDEKVIIYSNSASLKINSGNREIYLIPKYLCEIDSQNVGVPYSLSASEELKNAVSGYNLNENKETLLNIIQLSEKSDALTLFNLLTLADRTSMDILINKLHSLVSLPKDVSPYRIADLDKGELKKWLNAIEEQN